MELCLPTNSSRQVERFWGQTGWRHWNTWLYFHQFYTAFPTLPAPISPVTDTRWVCLGYKSPLGWINGVQVMEIGQNMKVSASASDSTYYESCSDICQHLLFSDILKRFSPIFNVKYALMTTRRGDSRHISANFVLEVINIWS